ncbi:MAG: hypothetical protein V2A74_06735 [bacterium]
MRYIAVLIPTIFLVGCASLSSLPRSTSEVDFDTANEGKIGWSRYQRSFFFPGIDKTTALEAARVSLTKLEFAIKKENLEDGFVLGEHGMTLYDWNVVAGVYIKETKEGCHAKVIAQGSYDVGFAGDATATDWPRDILWSMRDYISRKLE